MIAQELLSNWMKSKLQRELISDGEDEVDTVLVEKPSAVPLKYERFDGESTTKQLLASFWRCAEEGSQASWFVRLRGKSCFEASIVGSVETILGVMIFLPQLLQQLAVGLHKCTS